ncbi:MAG: hypothetical protein M1339_00145 [Bacteroidetes bacterium]|nr:hypothetical protein [Bacteroidota bacterium]
MKHALTAWAVACLTAFSAPTLQEMLNQSDALFEKFDNKGAFELLLTANVSFPENGEVLWRLARAEMHIADNMPASTGKEKKFQLQTYDTAYQYADSAVIYDANNPMAYTYRAAVNGKIALFKGVFGVAPVVKQVREDCERAISLDPNDAIAYYILGRTNAKLAEKPVMFRWPLGLAWGNRKNAIKFYLKAISLDSTFIMFRLDLAKAYMQESNYRDAREQLQTIASLPIRDDRDSDRKMEAAKLLEEVKNKK